MELTEQEEVLLERLYAKRHTYGRLIGKLNKSAAEGLVEKKLAHSYDCVGYRKRRVSITDAGKDYIKSHYVLDANGDFDYEAKA